jgi:DNA-binding transcriptional MerR regulator
MAEWYVKDLSKLTHISVQTLHHYDRIDLLKPSVRLANGYRVYSEKDLLKLQQIIALKFFGFELNQIKSLLSNDDIEVLEHFSVQSKFLEQKANTLLEASNTLKRILSEVSDKSIPWETIIQLIEVYRMTQQLEHPWVKEIFTPDELKQYVEFETQLKNSTPEQKAAFENSWALVVEEIKQHLNDDPFSQLGINLGERFMHHVNKLYGRKYAHLRTKKFERGFGEGRGLEETGLTPEVVSWIEKAVDAYYRNLVRKTLAQVGKIPSADMLRQWNDMLDDMYGQDNDRKKIIVDIALQDESVSSEAKKWLKK